MAHTVVESRIYFTAKKLRFSEFVSFSSALTLKLRQIVWMPDPRTARQPAATTASSRRHFCSSRMGRSKLEAHAEQMHSNKVTLIVFISSTFPPQPLLFWKPAGFRVLKGHVPQKPDSSRCGGGWSARGSCCVIDTGAMTQSETDVCCHGSPGKPRRRESEKYSTF